MASFKEIVTKAVVGKGKKVFTQTETVHPEMIPTTVLGCWVINHNFKGTIQGDKVRVDGSYDVNIWYSCEDDTKTEVVRQTNTYTEIVSLKRKIDEDITGEEVIVRSLKQPTCIKAEIIDDGITYTIEKELGIEIVGDTKVKIPIEEEEDPWDDLIDDEMDQVEAQIDSEVDENYLKEDTL